MSAVTEKTITSLSEYVELIATLRSSTADSLLWLRGCTDFKNHSLQPSLCRHPSRRSVAERSKLEEELLTYFRQRGVPFGTPPLPGDWEPLFYMQHYRIPTRLLDWSESPFVALYFAVLKAKQAGRGRRKDACVWALDPVSWNRHALSDISYNGGVLSVNDEGLKGHVFQKGYVNLRAHPVALYGTHNSSRIVAQRGVFVVFGQNSASMESACVTQNFPNDCLVKIKIPGAVLPAVQDSLRSSGMTASVVFPDLEGFAREVNQHFHFEP